MAPNPLERRGIELLIDKATAMGVPVPDEIRRILSDGSVHNTGAFLWSQAHPDDDEFRSCCIGNDVKGPEHCTCWLPEWNAVQAEPVLPPKAEDLAPQSRMCGDCAFRPGSPEREDEWLADSLYSLPAQNQPFYCHDGMRRPVRWRHPDGRTIDGSTADWQPPIVNGIPYRLDGRAGSLCAGWAAIAAKAGCTCPDIDVSTLSEQPGSHIIKGHDPNCPTHRTNGR